MVRSATAISGRLSSRWRRLDGAVGCVGGSDAVRASAAWFGAGSRGFVHEFRQHRRGWWSDLLVQRSDQRVNGSVLGSGVGSG